MLGHYFHRREKEVNMRESLLPERQMNGHKDLLPTGTQVRYILIFILTIIMKKIIVFLLF